MYTLQYVGGEADFKLDLWSKYVHSYCSACLLSPPFPFLLTRSPPFPLFLAHLLCLLLSHALILTHYSSLLALVVIKTRHAVGGTVVSKCMCTYCRYSTV